MMLYRFEVGYTVPGKMGNKNYVTAISIMSGLAEKQVYRVSKMENICLS